MEEIKEIWDFSNVAEVLRVDSNNLIISVRRWSDGKIFNEGDTVSLETTLDGKTQRVNYLIDYFLMDKKIPSSVGNCVVLIRHFDNFRVLIRDMQLVTKNEAYSKPLPSKQSGTGWWKKIKKIFSAFIKIYNQWINTNY